MPQGVKHVPSPLVWIDCEMTGLDPDTEEIIEIFCLITDGQLNLVDDTGFHAIVHQSRERMDQMDEWCTATHGNSGLTEAVISSNTSPEQAAEGLFAYITKFIDSPKTALLAGNSVHADRAFLRQQPYSRVVDFLHHRILDVSSIKEAAKRWCPSDVLTDAPAKQGLHKAKEDIVESIEEAKFYRNTIFRSTQPK